MNLVSVTRLRIRQLRFFPAFAYYAFLSMVAARRTAGNVCALSHRQRGWVFWTITVWRDEQAMRAFRNQGAHQKVMPKLAVWCDEATYVHWQQAVDEPPSFAAAYARLVRDGIVSRVNFPSENHASKNFPAPG